MSTHAAVAAASGWILRRARVAHIGDDAVDLDVDALPAIELAGTPGWLTGEPLLDQGVEVSMPNLPRDLPLPGVEVRPFRCRVEIVGPAAVRIVVAPAGARVFAEQPTWLGIVTEPTIGSTSGSIIVDDEHVVVETSLYRLTIGLTPFRIEFGDQAAPTLRTAERLRQVAGFPMAPPVRFREWGPTASQRRIVVNLELASDEQIMGFGEQFSRVVKNGQQLVLRCEDALGTGTGMAYKPAPVWHSTRGYTGFINTGAEVGVDVGHVRPSVLSLDTADEALDLYLFGGRDPAARLAAYTTLTGRGDRPPLWAFGYWMGRCRYHSNHEMLAVADEMRERQIPIDVLHVDPDWLVVDRLNTDFIWNTDRFGELGQFVADLADRAIRLSVWEVPYLDPISPRYAEAEAAGFLLRTPTGGVAELRGTPTPDGRHRGLVDVTNPDAIRWWQSLHGPFLDAGVAAFKTDFGEGCPDEIATVDGTPAHHVHNLYPLRYNAAVSDAIRDRTGRAPLVWGRSAWAGSHRYPGQWGGDAESTVAGMQATLRGGLSHALSNPGFWSHDIGGFFGRTHPGPLRSVDTVRRPVAVDARPRVAATRTMGVRRRRAGHHLRLDPAAVLPPAVPLAGGRRGHAQRAADDAAVGARISRRSHRTVDRRPVPPRRRRAGGAGPRRRHADRRPSGVPPRRPMVRSRDRRTVRRTRIRHRRRADRVDAAVRPRRCSTPTDRHRRRIRRRCSPNRRLARSELDAAHLRRRRHPHARLSSGGFRWWAGRPGRRRPSWSSVTIDLVLVAAAVLVGAGTQRITGMGFASKASVVVLFPLWRSAEWSKAVLLILASPVGIVPGCSEARPAVRRLVRCPGS